MKEKCLIKGCTHLKHAQRLCAAHYYRWRKYQDVGIAKVRKWKRQPIFSLPNSEEIPSL